MNDENKIFSVIAKSFKVDQEELTNETLFNDLGIDSLTMLELVLNIEDEVSVDIPDADVADLISIGDVIDYVKRKKTL